jgi:hypothetical protein
LKHPFLDAVIQDGPNNGLTVGQCIAFGLALTGDNNFDEGRAENVRDNLTERRLKAQRMLKMGDEHRRG